MVDLNWEDENLLARRDESLLVERENLTLRQRSTDILRQAIVDNRFKPGTHLKERELCDLLGVSRTSIREALRHLESEHLIEMVPHRGPVVISLSVEDAINLYQVRAALEGLVGELFAAHATDQQIKALEDKAAEMANAAENIDPKVILPIIENFYEILFEGSQNQVCTQIIQSLNARISLLRRKSLSRKERAGPMMKEISKIVVAASKRDAGALRQACIAHVKSASKAVMPLLVARK